jgi:hypothetical protein
MMSLSTCSQPSFEITGRLGSTARVRAVSACAKSRCAVTSAACGTPQLSLSTTQVTMHGWLASRSRTSSHSDVRRWTVTGE